MHDQRVTGGSISSADPIFAGLLGSSPPRITPDEASRLLAAQFGLDAEARELACERDQNFHVLAADGRQFVLKISNPQEPAESTAFQTEALRWIARVDPDLPVPRSVPSLDGGQHVPITLSDGRRSLAWVLTWLEGLPLHLAPRAAATDRAIGDVSARLGLALRDFRHPASAHELLWDLKHHTRLRPLMAALPPDEVIRSLRPEMDHFEAEVLPRLAGLRHQVVHNDMNHHNIMRDPERPDRISGVIDFGDMVDTCLAIDVAVGASYLADHPTDPLGAVVNMVSAYHAVRPLAEQEIAVLRDLIVARLVTSIIITGWRAQRYPANAAYILRNNGPARRAMLNFATLDRDRVQDALRRGCDME